LVRGEVMGEVMGEGFDGGRGRKNWAWGLTVGAGIVNCVFTPQA
jgi:hypothetical protein